MRPGQRTRANPSPWSSLSAFASAAEWLLLRYETGVNRPKHDAHDAHDAAAAAAAAAVVLRTLGIMECLGRVCRLVSCLCLRHAFVWLQSETCSITTISTWHHSYKCLSLCTRYKQTAATRPCTMPRSITVGESCVSCARCRRYSQARHTSHDQTGGGWTGCSPPCACCTQARDASWAPPWPSPSFPCGRVHACRHVSRAGTRAPLRFSKRAPLSEPRALEPMAGVL